MSDNERNQIPAAPAPAQNRPAAAEQESEVDLLEILFRLLGGWKLIVCLAVAGALIAGIYTHYFVTPMYEATASIYVVSRNDSVINMADLQIGTALTNDYIRVFDMWPVQEQVRQELDLPYTYSYLRNHLKVRNSGNTRIIDITYSSSNANEAMEVANKYAEVVCSFIAETMSTSEPNIMSSALLPSNPVSPSLKKNVVIGFAAGVLLASAIIIIRMLADDKYKSVEDIRRFTGLTTLAVVPIDDSMEVEREKADREDKRQRKRRSK